MTDSENEPTPDGLSPDDILLGPVDPPEPPPLPERTIETEHPDLDLSYLPLAVAPTEGESYMDAYTRTMREKAGIVEPEEADASDGEVLGVLTGQVAVKSAPIAMAQPEDEGSE